MNEYLQTWQAGETGSSNQQMICALQSTLDATYERVFASAAAEWDRRFRGKDPADACVTVRVSSVRTLRQPHGFPQLAGHGVN